MAWRSRGSGLPVLFPHGMRPDSLASGGSPETRPTLACLLPVRNGETGLEGYLDSVSPFADAILALDDGSTDGTAEALDLAKGIEVVHTEPPRDSYAEWDDRRNRQILLDAARRRGFDWVLYLDADERICPMMRPPCARWWTRRGPRSRLWLPGLRNDRTRHLRPRRTLGLPALAARAVGYPPEAASISCRCPVRSSLRT